MTFDHIAHWLLVLECYFLITVHNIYLAQGRTMNKARTISNEYFRIFVYRILQDKFEMSNFFEFILLYYSNSEYEFEFFQTHLFQTQFFRIQIFWNSKDYPNFIHFKNTLKTALTHSGAEMNVFLFFIFLAYIYGGQWPNFQTIFWHIWPIFYFRIFLKNFEFE